LQQPEWVFLDEATAALDETAEQNVYRLLTERLPNATIVSIAHRPEVARFHTTRYAVTPAGCASTDGNAPQDEVQSSTLV
jgi:putative ATP-binding cassette transporter